MVNVVVSRKRPIHITANGAGVIETTSPATLQNMPVIMGGASSMSNLSDVNMTNKTDGAVPIYDEPTHTFVVQHLDFSEITGDIDGGEF